MKGEQGGRVGRTEKEGVSEGREIPEERKARRNRGRKHEDSGIE